MEAGTRESAAGSGEYDRGDAWLAHSASVQARCSIYCWRRWLQGSLRQKATSFCCCLEDEAEDGSAHRLPVCWKVDDHMTVIGERANSLSLRDVYWHAASVCILAQK